MVEYGRIVDRCKRQFELFMSNRVGLAALLAVAACSFLDAARATPTSGPWMTEEAMRQAFIGKTLDGHYGNGITWSETYLESGRLDYREAQRHAAGNWHFRGHVFCTFYDPPPIHPPLNGGCWTTIKVSANCYEFYLAGLTPEPPFEDDVQDANRRWNARGWRNDERSTCTDKPSV